MRKLIVCVLCLLLPGCVALPVFPPERSAAPSAQIVAVPTSAEATPRPVPGVTRELVPAATFTPAPTATPAHTPTPAPTPTPTPLPTPTPTPAPRTFTGGYLRFDVPYDWMEATTPKSVYFYPDMNDTRHTFLLYQEVNNSMKLTERSVDIALIFSSPESIAAMVAGTLTDSGMTNIQLSPLSVEKTQLNGLTCYRGASDIVLEGEAYDFVGHVFLRGNKLILLVWVGDEAQYGRELDMVYRSIESIR